MSPVGKLCSDLLKKDHSRGKNHVLTALDAFSDKRYDVFWKRAPEPKAIWMSTAKHTGCEWTDVANSSVVEVVITMADRAPFCVFGDASGFKHSYIRMKEQTFNAPDSPFGERGDRFPGTIGPSAR